MTLILTIENEQSLPNGAPMSVRLGPKGGLDIGRSANLDWTFPDPSRFISGKHCEVRYRDHAYWLYDISANGTFLNSSTSRIQAPHRLRTGDRLAIGTYIIAVAIEPDDEPDLPIDAFASADSGKDLRAEPEPARAAANEAWISEKLAPRVPDTEVEAPHVQEPAPIASELSGEEFLRRFALGAGVPEQIFARQDGLQVAEELGALLRTATESVTRLLSARFKAERLARVSAQTTVEAFDNNPLKFAPSAEDALKLMFGPRTRGYLDARRAFEGAFLDLMTHQVDTYAAMQQAVRMIVEDLDPKEIDAAADRDRGLSKLFGSRKARLWDMYLARWQAKTRHHEDGLAGAFMLYFGKCYDQAKEAKMHRAGEPRCMS